MHEVTRHEELIAEADADYAAGRYKQAHIKYGQAVAMGSTRNHYCRQMRGIASRMVAEQRLQKAVDHPGQRQAFLNQAARWLAKSEANLSSAFDESPEDERGRIRLEQAGTEEVIARFMEMCGAGGDPRRRLDAARAFRDHGNELLAHA